MSGASVFVSVDLVCWTASAVMLARGFLEKNNSVIRSKAVYSTQVGAGVALPHVLCCPGMPCGNGGGMPSSVSTVVSDVAGPSRQVAKDKATQTAMKRRTPSLTPVDAARCWLWPDSNLSVPLRVMFSSSFPAQTSADRLRRSHATIPHVQTNWNGILNTTA